MMAGLSWYNLRWWYRLTVRLHNFGEKVASKKKRRLELIIFWQVFP